MSLDSGIQEFHKSIQVKCWIFIPGNWNAMLALRILICFREVYKDKHLLTNFIKYYVIPC